MGVIFTESFAWGAGLGAYKNYQTFQTGIHGPDAGSPWPGAYYANMILGQQQNWICTPTGLARVIVGSRFIYGSNTGSETQFNLFVLDPAHGAPALQLNLGNTGICTVYQGLALNGGGSTSIGTFTTTVDNNWHYWEVDFNLFGNVVVRKDESTVFTVASTLGAGWSVGQVQWGAGGSGFGGGSYYADVYVVDPTTSPNNSFLGDVHIECRHPTGSGASTQWAPVGAVSNWQCVDDTTPDGDTTYVQSGIANQRDYYATPNINEAAPSAVYAVGTWAIAKAPSVGAGGIQASLSSAGSQVDGPVVLPNFSSYAIGPQPYVYADVDPHTGSAWTVAGANAAQPGIALHANP